MSTYQERLKDAGNTERDNMVALFNHMNSMMMPLDFKPTPSGMAVCFDGVLTLNPGPKQKRCLVEAKVRKGDWPSYILEKKKCKLLLDEAAKTDKNHNKPEGTTEVLYIQFTPTATYIYNLTKISNAKKLPKVTKMDMNRVTVNSTSDKVTKEVYMLPIEFATKISFTYGR